MGWGSPHWSFGWAEFENIVNAFWLWDGSSITTPPLMTSVQANAMEAVTTRTPKAPATARSLVARRLNGTVPHKLALAAGTRARTLATPHFVLTGGDVAVLK